MLSIEKLASALHHSACTRPAEPLSSLAHSQQAVDHLIGLFEQGGLRTAAKQSIPADEFSSTTKADSPLLASW
jgi:hypothetical protein